MTVVNYHTHHSHVKYMNPNANKIKLMVGADPNLDHMYAHPRSSKNQTKSMFFRDCIIFFANEISKYDRNMGAVLE